MFLHIKLYLHGFFYSPNVFRLLLDFPTMNVILMQHTANCLVTHSFSCSIFNHSSQFRGTQPRISFLYFIKYIPFLCSTEHSSLWFYRLILHVFSIIKLINHILYRKFECVLLTNCPILGRQ